MSLLTTASKVINTYGAVKSTVDAVRSIFGSGGGKKTNAVGNGKQTGFLAAMRKRGVARKNRFDVVISAPLMLAGQDKEINLPLYAESVSMPGVAFATSDIRRYGHGPIEKKPYAPIFNDITVNFIADGQGVVHKFFYKWMRGIVSFDNPQPSTLQAGSQGLAPFEVNFKDQYRSDIEIYTYNETNDTVIKIKLFSAYPLSIGEVPLNWADQDEFMSLPVSFTYLNMQMENVDLASDSSPAALAKISTLQKLLGIGSALQVLSTIRKPRSIADVVNVVNNAKIVIGGLRGPGG